MIILTYATSDGTQVFRRTGAHELRRRARYDAAVNVDPENLGFLGDSDMIDQYAAEAQRMRAQYDPDDVI